METQLIPRLGFRPPQHADEEALSPGSSRLPLTTAARSGIAAP